MKWDFTSQHKSSIMHNHTSIQQRLFTQIRQLFIYLSFFTLVSFYSTEILAQSPPIQHQEMRIIGELTGHVDVGFQVVKCDNSNSNQVFLLFINESERYGEGSDVTAEFDLVILDYENGFSFTETLNISIPTGQTMSADCDIDNSLKIDLPEVCAPASIAAYIQQH